MAKTSPRGMCSVCLILLLGTLLLSHGVFHETANAFSQKEPNHRYKNRPIPTRQESLSQSDSPILIDSDSDFAAHSYPGSGTLEDPYILRDLWIDNTDGISILNVNSHFVIIDCVFWTANSINIENAHGFRIENNEFRQFGGIMGISIYGSSSFVVRNNEFIPDFIPSEDISYDMGVDIQQSSDGVVILNDFLNCWNAVNFYGTNITVSENTIWSDYAYSGITSMSSGNLITGNEITGFDQAILLSGSHDNIVSENNCFANSIGISVSGSQRNSINQNSLLYNSYLGIQVFSDSISNVISENRFEYNSMYGIEFAHYSAYGAMNPESNQVFRNVFIGNNNGDIQAYDENPSNGFGYNYWSDWAYQSDDDNDGFLDSPYPIGGGILVDPYPLVNESLAYSLEIDSVPVVDPWLRFFSQDIMLTSIVLSWVAILVVPNVKWYFDDKKDRLAPSNDLI